VSVTPELTIFLKPDAASTAAEQLAKRIRSEHAHQVSGVRIIPKDRALKDLRENPAWEQALKVLPNNPLPDAVVVAFTPGEDLAARANELARVWRSWPNVDLVQLDSAWVQRLEALLRFGKVGLLLLALSVMLVVLATVFNTVRMQALSQREEIGVARLVGATEGFVRRPFLYLGARTCTLAALISIGIARGALMPLNDALASLARSYDAEFALALPSIPVLCIAVLAVACLGALSARWSVERNTRF
jgi:cell division transport system permease protein